MHIICLTPLAEGVYNDNRADHITAPPEGWAYIPEDFSLPSTFPRLGSIEAEELTYTREVKVQRVVTKTREVEREDDEGNSVVVTEEYADVETSTEVQEYTMMTVTAMTEGTLPEAKETEATLTVEERVAVLEESNAELTEAVDLLLSGVTE